MMGAEKDNYKIVYVFNGYNWLWRQLMVSILTLRRYVQNNIVVFYGPPRFQEHIDWLTPRCELHLVETPLNSPEFRAGRVYFKNELFGAAMKLHAYSVDTPIMIHLDCDTIIHRNFLELLDDDYDLLVGDWVEGRSPFITKENRKRLELPPWNLPMDGFYIFKNHTYLKFKPIYEDYIVKLLLGELKCHDNFHINVHAFNLAISHFIKNGFRVKKMEKGYHAYAGGEYVQHLEHKEIANWMEPRVFSEEENRIKGIGG